MKIEQDDEVLNKKNKKPKIVTIISILIVITLLIVIGIVVLMMYTKEEKTKLYIDGIGVAYNEDTFKFTEGTGEMYISIRDIAGLVGYEAHNRRI